MAEKAIKSWKEERRKRAWALYQAGWAQKQIAEALDITKGAVSQWIKAGKEGGEAALKSGKSTGKPRRLKTEERQKLPELLKKGAESFGFRGDLWTCPRVAKVLEREFGVKYHPAHVSRILKELGWTPQKPIRRAKQRKEGEIKRWKEERWPALKKRRPRKDEPSFS
jgi:transposase